MSTTIESVGALNDHWWWRPGWKAGRHFYACHVAIEGHEEIQGLVEVYQRSLAGLEGLDCIPAPWLHMSMQGIGFVDEVDPALLAQVMTAIQGSLASMAPVPVTFGEVVVRGEAVYLPATPSEPIRNVKAAVRAAISGVLGPELAEGLRDDLAKYRPHISVAYSNRSQPAGPIVERLASVQVEPVRFDLHEVSILEFHRDHRMYEWVSAQPLPLGVRG